MWRNQCKNFSNYFWRISWRKPTYTRRRRSLKKSFRKPWRSFQMNFEEICEGILLELALANSHKLKIIQSWTVVRGLPPYHPLPAGLVAGLFFETWYLFWYKSLDSLYFKLKVSKISILNKMDSKVSFFPYSEKKLFCFIFIF